MLFSTAKQLKQDATVTLVTIPHHHQARIVQSYLPDGVHM